MKNLFNKFMRISSKTKIAIVITLLTIAVPAIINAWGPDRQLFTMAKPATFVTFNSITDNSIVGDERNFVVIKDAANTSDGGWKDDVTVERGKEYLVRVYVHNNAADNLGLKALNTRVSAGVPTNTAKNISISGFVTSDNATPKQVWDDASFNSSENFNLVYVAGSAEIYNNGYARGGKSLPDSIVTSAGAKIGFDGPDGIVPGCFKYDNFIFFKVKPQFAPVNDYSFTKQVRKEGSTEWSKSVQANPGDTVEYMLSYKNTGEVRQNNVVMRDQLPDKISLINDTTYLKNGTNPNGLRISNNISTPTGVNIGDYNAQAAAYVKYSAKVASLDKLVCGKNELINRAKVVVDGTQIEDSATVTVNKDCPPEPVYTCKALTVQTLERTKFKFSTSYNVQNATLKSITYVVKDASGKEVYRGTNDTYTQETVGKYSVEAHLVVTVNGKDVNVPVGNCVAQFEVKPKPTNPAITITKKVNGQDKITTEVNKPFTYTVVVKNTGDVGLKDAKVSDPAPAGVTFQSADRGEINNNTWTYTIANLKVGASETFKITAVVKDYKAGELKNTACVDTPTIPGSPDACDNAKVEVEKPEEPKQIIVCRLEDKKYPVTIYEKDFDSSKYSKNPEDCKEEPNEIKVCRLEDKKYPVVIKESDFDSTKYSKNPNDCVDKPVTPPVTPPTTPTELPKTGMGPAMNIVGLGALIASTLGYVASRRNLL